MLWLLEELGLPDEIKRYLAADRPHLLAFLQRIHARPAYQRALAQGGEYALAKD